MPATTEGHRIRNDVRVPVLTLQSETDVTLLGGHWARQPDSSNFRLWEVAGAAHFDTYGLHASLYDDGFRTAAELAQLISSAGTFEPEEGPSYNCGWQQHYVLQSAAHHLERWARAGIEPPTAARLEVNPVGTTLRRDDMGIAVGGVRTPWVDVPLATLSGARESTQEYAFGMLFGSTMPLPPERKSALYPTGRDEFLARFSAATDKALELGHLLAADRDEIVAVADEAWSITTTSTGGGKL